MSETDILIIFVCVAIVFTIMGSFYLVSQRLWVIQKKIDYIAEMLINKR